ncbi:MAG: decaprenyl-phosphate phosphoribosyltransferase [Chloroflexi bacterium]|nr:decaprenyl-phosphate phosphoribosyltransferase [Chloroflexota bacterium]
MLIGFMKTLRPRQWGKNFVVFLPFVFTLNQAWRPFTSEMYAMLAQTVVAFVLFCLLSGSVYLINDLADIEKDRLHPTKRNRPLPSGQLPAGAALAAALLLIALTLAASYAVRPLFAAIGMAYFVVNIGYSLVFKNWVIVDVFAVSSGFVLRAVAGAVVINVPVSPWLYVVAILGALFLGINKRRNELVTLGSDAGNHRAVLEHYTLPLLDEMTSVVTSATVMAYSLYTFSAENLPKDHSMMLTIPFVIYGIFRYLYLIHVRHEGGDPSELLFRDRPLLVAILMWGAAVVTILILERSPAL